MTTEATEAGTLAITIRSDFQPTFDDMVTLESMNEKDAQGRPVMKWREVRDLLNRAIEGGAGGLPAADPAVWTAIGAALKAHFEARANPNG
jgi:hypothetical protein